MISEETVSHVGKLARLELSPEEIRRYTEELGKILHLVDELAELNLSAFSQDLLPEYPTRFRQDDTTWSFDCNELLQNAPDEENGFFRVPKILDEYSPSPQPSPPVVERKQRS